MLPTQSQPKLVSLRSAADKITATPEDYGLVADDATALTAAVTAAESAAADAETYTTLKQSKVTAAQSALDAAETLFRQQANTARFTPSVTDEKLADLGLARRQPPSRIGAPVIAPEIAIEGNPGIGSVDLRMVQPDTRSASLPDEADHIIVSLVDGTQPVAAGEADKGIKSTKTTSRCTVDTNVGFARLRVYAAYMGRRGQIGPWSLPAQFSPPTP